MLHITIPSTMKKLLFSACICLSAAGMLCAQKMSISNPTPFELSRELTIAIAPASIRYMDLNTDALLPKERYNGEAVAAFFDRRLEALLLQQQLPLCAGPDSLFIGGQQRLLAQGYALVRALQDEKTASELKSNFADAGCRLIMVADIRVKVGDDAEWEGANPLYISLVVHPQTHTTRIKTALIDTASASVLWKNELETKGIPDVAKPRWAEVFETIFSNIKTK